MRKRATLRFSATTPVPTMRAITWLVLTTLICGSCAAVPAPQVPAPATVTLHGHRFTVEVATTPAAREHGLMDRTAMPAGHGMLFVFPAAAPRTFWMKNTLIPLDILYFDAAMRLVGIQANAQPCRADPCALYPSGAPARYVLELNAGTAARIGVRRGDVIGLPAASSGTQ